MSETQKQYQNDVILPISHSKRTKKVAQLVHWKILSPAWNIEVDWKWHWNFEAVFFCSPSTHSPTTKKVHLQHACQWLRIKWLLESQALSLHWKAWKHQFQYVVSILAFKFAESVENVLQTLKELSAVRSAYLNDNNLGSSCQIYNCLDNMSGHHVAEEWCFFLP